MPCPVTVLGLLQGQAVLDQRLTVQPASLSSAFHKRLTANADRKHAKQLRVRHTATVANPLKERAEREKREEDRIRSRQVLERKQACPPLSPLATCALHPSRHVVLSLCVTSFENQ